MVGDCDRDGGEGEEKVADLPWVDCECECDHQQHLKIREAARPNQVQYGDEQPIPDHDFKHIPDEGELEPFLLGLHEFILPG